MTTVSGIISRLLPPLNEVTDTTWVQKVAIHFTFQFGEKNKQISCRKIIIKPKKKKVLTCESKGFASRDTIPCKLITTAEAARTGSTDWWGEPARPFLPVMTALKKPQPASRGPGREPIMAVGYWWETWTAKMAWTSLKAPSPIILFAPFPASSAGWNSRITVPCRKSKMNFKFDI